MSTHWQKRYELMRDHVELSTNLTVRVLLNFQITSYTFLEVKESQYLLNNYLIYKNSFKYLIYKFSNAFHLIYKIFKSCAPTNVIIPTV